jgi:LysM repeat protein
MNRWSLASLLLLGTIGATATLPASMRYQQKGDTLSAIAKRFYGDGNAYPRVFETNREVIQDPDRIFPGQKIRIPRGAV